uniref:AIG1-type G domain-containing protein n=1 Tax=Biomphalaria glabrata TaxID=6526 RepID=A0A2C9LXX5_BIOGL
MAVNTSLIGHEIIRKNKVSLDKDSDIDLLLIGKTGHGKSSAGNSILRRQVFESGASTNSITIGVNFDFSEIDNRVIKVVDVRGVQETRETEAKSIALFIREMEHAVVANTAIMINSVSAQNIFPGFPVRADPGIEVIMSLSIFGRFVYYRVQIRVEIVLDAVLVGHSWGIGTY